MNTLMSGKRYPIASAVMAAVAAMALLAVMVVSSVNAAPEDSGEAMDDRIKQAMQECKAFGGGQGSTHFEFNLEGELDSATTTCVGGDLDGRVCTTTPATTDCRAAGGFVKPTESIFDQQRPDTAEQVENPEQTDPGADDREAPAGGVAEDPTAGDEVAEMQTIADQATVACEALGGTATVNAQHPTTTATFDVQCIGGMLDGMICYGTICDYFAAAPAGPGEDARVPPTGGVAEDPSGQPDGGIEFVQVASMEELEAVLRGAAEDPTGGDTVVVYSQHGNPVARAAYQAALCEFTGGTAIVSDVTWDESDGQGQSVYCKGGGMDQMFCDNTESYSFCFYRAVTPEDPRVTPSAGVEVPAGNVPTATIVATEAAPAPTATATAPMPTVAPTQAPVEPTVAPPSDPPPPKNDNSAPPSGPAEDPTESEPPATDVPVL